MSFEKVLDNILLDDKSPQEKKFQIKANQVSNLIQSPKQDLYRTGQLDDSEGDLSQTIHN